MKHQSSVYALLVRRMIDNYRSWNSHYYYLRDNNVACVAQVNSGYEKAIFFLWLL
jgi:hypothetical protein